MRYPISTVDDVFSLDSFFSLPVLTQAVSDYDAWEEDNKLFLQFPMPGYKEGSISVVVKDGILSIEAEEKKEEKERKFLVRSRTTKNFRSITLPEGLAQEQAKATYENGMLIVEIPHSEERKPKTLAVEYKG